MSGKILLSNEHMFVYLKESLISNLLKVTEIVEIKGKKGDWIGEKERYYTCRYGCILCSG